MSTDVEKLMKRCQIGVGGRNALDDAHSIMAECYGTLGRLNSDLTAARARVAELETLLWDACPNPSGINRYNEPAEWWNKRRALLSPSPEYPRVLTDEETRTLDDDLAAAIYGTRQP